MAIELAELVERTQFRANPPGTEFIVAEEEEWIARLATGFWELKLHKFFADFRLDIDDAIVNIAGGDDMPGEYQQLVILRTVYDAVQMKAFQMPTMSRAAAPGPLEAETQRQGAVIKQVLEGLEVELEELRKEIVLVGGETAVYVVDALLLREQQLYTWGAETYGWVL